MSKAVFDRAINLWMNVVDERFTRKLFLSADLFAESPLTRARVRGYGNLKPSQQRQSLVSRH
jgi:hypothetical protein